MRVLGWRSQQNVLVRKLTNVQRLACPMISSAFPFTPTGALEILLNVTPIEEFLLADIVRAVASLRGGGRGGPPRVSPFWGDTIL